MRIGSFVGLLITWSMVGSSSLTSGCSCTPQPTPSADRSSDDVSSTEEKAIKWKSDRSQTNSPSSSSDAKPGDAKTENSSQAKKEAATGKDSSEKRSGIASIAGALFGGESKQKTDQSSPKEAYRKALELEQGAIDLEKNGKSEKAFEKALEAWQLVRVHEKDEECSSQAQKLEPLIFRLGEAVNAAASRYRTTSKPLQIE